MNELLTLMVSFLMDGNSLMLTYSVTNKSPTLVYLSNLHVHVEQGAGPVPDPSVAFVTFEKEEVHITKRKPPMPQDKLYTPLPYYVTPLKPGATFKESLSLPLPLKQNIPYTSIQTNDQISKMKAVYFSLGYFESNPAIEAGELQRGGQKVFILRPSAALKKGEVANQPAVEKFLVSEKTQLEIPIIE
jgi:hypothetical protein